MHSWSSTRSNGAG
ncbi:DNA polymerase III epsilon subunit [Caballeronia sordidicola]|uniref:DNA polymerase III epsilon subunit n=1 Tax=Caballeronia sordidicola TaxID=196367 RepID=A0A242MQA4_CABSO|nr:DNA polymerase III epsilon subunit [Caballeronia sordidicola]